MNGHHTLPLFAAPRPGNVLEIVVEPLPADDVATDIVQEWGEQSFPASDPPANW